MDYLYVILIVNSIVEEIVHFERSTVNCIALGEGRFVQHMEAHIPDFAEFSEADIEACLEDGYVEFNGSCSIQLHWSDE